MTRNFMFFISILFSSHLFANQTCFEIYWRNSDSSSGIMPKQKDHLVSFVRLNQNPVYFSTVPGSIRYHLDGEIGSSISRGCAGNNLLNVGVNSLHYYYHIENTSHIKAGWFESLLVMIGGNRRETICRSLLSAGQVANDTCKAEFSRTLDELNPQLAQTIRDLASELANLQKYSKVDEFKSRFETAKEILQQLVNIDFENIKEGDYALFQQAQNVVVSLKKDITQLKWEIQETQERIKENLQNKGRILIDELKREGLASFEIPPVDLKIEVQEPQGSCSTNTTDDFNSDSNIYKTYADKVLDKLEGDLRNKDRISFLRQVDLWTKTIPNYETIALNQQKFSKKEWDAYSHHYDRVAKYIDTLVDKDLWFKDTPIPIEVRKAFKEELAELAPTESSSLESSLKRLSSTSLTEQEKRGIELVQALVFVGKELAKSTHNAYEAVQEFKDFLKETTDALGRGAKCLSQAQVSGRIGSLYELFSGKDQCDGSELSFVGRTMAGVEIALGTPKIFKVLGSVVGIGIFAKGSKAAEAVKASNVVVGSLKTLDIAADQTKNFLATLKKFKIDPALVKFPEGVSFNKNLKNHMKSFDGLTQKTGIKGAHNMKDFEALVEAKGIKIVSKTETPTKGIYEIKYEIQKLDKVGMPSGEMKAVKSSKTVYDPSIISDDEMLWLGQVAAASGEFNSKERMFDAVAGGISFRVYHESSVVINIHPTGKMTL